MSPLLVVVVLAQSVALQARGEDVTVEREAYAMGTRLRIVVEDPDTRVAAGAAEEVLREVERLERMLTTWQPEGELARLNAARPGDVLHPSPELVALLGEAEAWRRRTGGAFDPAVGALVDAWDLRGVGRRPSDRDIQAALAASGPAAVAIDASAGTVMRRREAAWMDSGAFGKGAALRSALRLLRERGVHRAFLDFGGQVAVLGVHHSVRVAHPCDRSEGVVRLNLRDGSAATSGASERRVFIDGAAFGHILDPRSGTPVPAWGSVTVVAGDPYVADVLSTALFVMGPDAGMEWAAETEYGVLFLDARGSRLRTTWNRSMERWLGESPRIDGAGPIDPCTTS